MIWRKLVGLAVLAVTALGSAGVARDASAQLTFCNRTGAQTQVAIAFRTGNTWTSRGWYTVQSGSCRNVLQNPLNQQYYYFHARQPGGQRWAGNYNNCVTPQRFTIRNSTRNCGGRGYQTVGFRQIVVNTSRHTVNLRSSGRAPGPGPGPGRGSVTYNHPRVAGHIVDWCQTWGRNCGNGGAHQFCRTRGHSGAIRWRTYNPGSTWVIGSRRVCRGGNCRGFRQVVCRR